MYSECCNAKSMKCESQAGWLVNGVVLHVFYECVACKGICATVMSEPRIKQQELKHDEIREG
jgi:hypothetical protein